jgi:pyruvate/2-oxoglutarate dehydrogenase complex dihydrolipoamide acyltransferase (E2) component
LSSSPTETSLAPVDVTMPQMGVSVAEGTIVAWRKAPGETIVADETICEISTDKIDTEVPSPISGTVAEILVAADATVTVGTVLARIAPAGGQGRAEPPAGGNGRPKPDEVESRNGSGRRARRYSPVVQRIAAEHGIDLDRVSGTGRDGRVRKQDVLAVLNDHEQPAPSPPEPPLHIESPYRPDPVPEASQGASATELSRMRRQIGRHMKRSLETAAHCTTWIEVDMSRVQSAQVGLRLTALAFVARATIVALREYPALNAWLEDERYTAHEAVHLGIAVSLGEDGLLVPVIHDAQDLSAEGLGARIRALASRAHGGELTPDEVRGGTFTITNPGQYGSIMATPIINQPQVAILDLEAIVKRPVVVTDAKGNDAIAIRPMTILGLSWDHRALDGALAAQFLANVKRVLEDWNGA